FHADEAIPGAPLPHEIANAAPWLQYQRVTGNAEPRDGVMNAGNDERRCVERVERRTLSAGILFRREERFQLVAERLACGVLVTVRNRIGKDRQGHGAESGESRKGLLLLCRRRPP